MQLSTHLNIPISVFFGLATLADIALRSDAATHKLPSYIRRRFIHSLDYGVEPFDVLGVRGPGRTDEDTGQACPCLLPLLAQLEK